jgi:hypothetical protein
MTDHVTVVPVVEYEPPAVGVPPCPPPSPNALRRSRTRRLLRAVGPAASPCDPPSARAAATFADAVLRSVLEVVDRRRPVAQLRPLLNDGLLDTVVALARAPQSGRAGAVLRRVRLRIVDRDGDAAEVFATYSRGDRVRAIAGRVEQTTVKGHRRWQLVALHIG